MGRVYCNISLLALSWKMIIIPKKFIRMLFAPLNFMRGHLRVLQLLWQMDVGPQLDSTLAATGSHNSPLVTTHKGNGWPLTPQTISPEGSNTLLQSIPHSVLLTWGSVRLIKPQSLLWSLATDRGAPENHWAHHHKVELWTHERHAYQIISLESDRDSIMWMAPASRMTQADKCYYMQMILILPMDPL